MKRCFQNRSILFKLLAAGIGTILFTASLSFAMMTYFFSYSDRSDRIQIIADSITIQMLSARVAEKNFVLRDLQKEEFFKTGNSTYLKEYRAQISSAREEILKLINLSTGEAKKYAESLLRLVDDYNTLLLEMVVAYRERGFKDWGLLGQWRQAIHDVERSVLKMNRHDLQENLLQLRRHEKDYLLRGEISYIDGIMHQLAKLRDRISRIRDPVVFSTLKELDTYEAAFKKYIVIEEKIGRTDREGLQMRFFHVALQMKPAIDKILTEAHLGKNRVRRDFILASVFIYFFGIGLGSIIFYLFARSISATLVELKNAALNVGRGQFDTKIAIQAKDEVGIVAAAFNKMTDDLDKMTVSKNYVDKIIQSVADMLIVVDPDMRIITMNQAVLDLLGYSEEELTGKSLEQVVYKESDTDSLLHKISNQEFNRNIEMIFIRKSGRKIPVLFASSMMLNDDGSLQGIVCIAQDNTERKAAEEALKKSEKELRLLSAKILSAQEDERKRVARELHDGIGQALTGIKFSVENAVRMMHHPKELPKFNPLESTIPLIQNTIEEARRIAIGLRPSSLDDLGIAETIHWFCQQFHNIYSDIFIDSQVDIAEDQVSDILKTAIFRILQESFNNVAKHSRADLIRFRLRQTGNAIELSIEDNGIGFVLEQDTLREDTDRGFGLASMKERAELSGGVFRVNSEPGKGSVIRVTWPNSP